MFLLRCGTFSENELNPTENETMVETKNKNHTLQLYISIIKYASVLYIFVRVVVF